MKRLAVAELLHETSSFGLPLTTLDQFRREPLPDVHGTLAGFRALPELLGEDVAWVELLRAAAPAGGPVATPAFERLLSELTGRLSEETVDGVLLSLDGATAAAADPDATGSVLARVREVVGPRVPVVAVLGIHANVTRRILSAADILIGPHTFPVTDYEQTGRRAAQALADLLKVGGRPEISAWKLPLIATDEGQGTADGTLAHVWEHFATAESLPGMVSVALFRAHHLLDAPELGWVFYQACFCDSPALDERAVVRACWESRRRPAAVPLLALPYRRVSRPLYPLDDLDELPLAAWAGDMVHPCHCAQTACEPQEAEGEGGCGGCGKCCDRTPAES